MFRDEIHQLLSSYDSNFVFFKNNKNKGMKSLFEFVKWEKYSNPLFYHSRGEIVIFKPNHVSSSN